VRNNAVVTWKTDSALKDRASYYVPMEEIVEEMTERDPLRFGIFQKERYLVKSYLRGKVADKVSMWDVS
jgi:hypothetical protein